MLIPKYYLDDSISSFLDGDNKMKCDIYEKEGKYYVEMDLAGFNKDEISVECEKGNILIKASKKEVNDEHDERTYIRRERVYNELSRSFYLGDIEEDEISAKYQDGTLTVIVPKKQKVETKKSIEIL